MLANRLRKRFKHLRKWARRSEVSCFRLYERDIPEFPCIIDWYDGDVVAWTYRRKRDETDEADRAFIELVRSEICDGLDPHHCYLKRRERQRGNTQYERTATFGRTRVIEEQGLRFEVNLSDYLDTGLFLDHRHARALIRERAAGKRVCNLFAYTGSFSVYAAAGGASAITTVDLSRTYLDWAERNYALNELDDIPHEIIHADVLAWLGETHETSFDLIVCDPPTFSNSKRMQRDWNVREDHPWLWWRLWNLLEPGGTAFFSTNDHHFELASSGLPPFAATEITSQTVPQDFDRRRPHRSWWLVKPG